MNLLQCVTAYTALLGLMEREMDYASAYGLVELKRFLKPHVEYYAKAEMDLAREYAVVGEQGEPVLCEGRFTFRQPERAPEWGKRHQELGMVPVQECWKVREIRLAGNVQPAYLEALEPFFTFGGA